MKLYIPTCTLNFNNIFSTESISPAGFYAKRGFGNRRYYTVEANNFDNVVMLYSKYPLFKVENQDLENGPMVIEIDTESCPGFEYEKLLEKGNVEVYTSSSTIYFNPFNCTIYFASYEDMQTVLNKADQSLENKYSKLYSTSLKVYQNNSSSRWGIFSQKTDFEWGPSYVNGAELIPTENPKKDLLIDRLKGCLVCYTIGANISVSNEVGRLKQISRKIRNILSAVINSPDHKPTTNQDSALLAYVKEFNSIYSQLDYNAKYNSELIHKSLVSPSTGLTSDVLQNVLKDLGLIDIFYKKLNLRPIYDAYDIFNSLSLTSTQEIVTFEMNKMNAAIRNIELAQRKTRPIARLSDLISYENKSIIIKDGRTDRNQFLETLLDSQMNGEYESFKEANNIEEPLAIAFVGGGKLKALMNNDWDGSNVQDYVNKLLSNLQKGDAIDIFSIDCPILQSFAAFCQKGDDIDRLKDYMLQMGFGDYQYALALYGATHGFASLPKTFTNALFKPSDYYITFYEELTQVLFGIKVKTGTFPPAKLDRGLDYPTDIAKEVISKMKELEVKPSKQEKVVAAIKTSGALEDQKQNPRAFMYILDNILGTQTNAYKALKKADFANDQGRYNAEEFREKIISIIEPSLPRSLKSRNETLGKINKSIELEAKRNDYNAFIYILDNYLSSSDETYKKIVKLVEHLKPKAIESSSSMIHNNRSIEVPELPKITAFSAFVYRETIYKRIIENWDYTGKQHPYDRAEHIRHFINICKQEGRGERKSALNEIFDERIASYAEKELRDIFHV